tara:strand:- start:156 stop:455 length:300 start_codon:yes stop_codon:yes gene_type:complete
MISITSNKILTKSQLDMMGGNKTYMAMLSNKLTISEFRVDGKDLDTMYDLLNHTQGFVYYELENTYGHGVLEILFENPIDMENYRVNISTILGIEEISK